MERFRVLNERSDDPPMVRANERFSTSTKPIGVLAPPEHPPNRRRMPRVMASELTTLSSFFPLASAVRALRNLVRVHAAASPGPRQGDLAVRSVVVGVLARLGLGNYPLV